MTGNDMYGSGSKFGVTGSKAATDPADPDPDLLTTRIQNSRYVKSILHMKFHVQ